ncbi:MAG: hypothetical protein U0237_07020 [Thermoleophilia bacterium]
MTRGRRLLAAAAAAAALLTAGCGGDGTTSDAGPAVSTAPAETFPSSVDGGVTTVPPTVPAPTGTAPAAPPAVTTGADVGAVRVVLQRYIDAFIAADGATACGLLTEESAQAFLADVGPGVGATTCADAFTAVTRQVPQEQRDAFRGAVIDRLSVSGDTAAGRLTVVGVPNEIRLVRRFGDWKIANLPGQ